MADSSPSGSGEGRYGDLLPRLVVGVVLVGLAVWTTYQGGVVFALFAAVVSMLLFGEWAVMHGGARVIRLAGMAALAGIVLAAQFGFIAYALAGIAAAAALFCALGVKMGLGLLYAGLPALALLWVRGHTDGFALVIWALAIVWATDVFAYFAGRMIGGPKLAPAISPGKTWAGLGGGMLGAAAVSAWLNHALAIGLPVGIAGMSGLVLACVAQAGDFYESHLKRSAGVKDSGNLLPGHGGVMDRLDGVIPVVIVIAAGLWALR